MQDIFSGFNSNKNTFKIDTMYYFYSNIIKIHSSCDISIIAPWHVVSNCYNVVFTDGTEGKIENGALLIKVHESSF